MNIEFERTVDDLIEFNLFHMANSSSIKRQLFTVQLLVGVLVLILLFVIFYLQYHYLSTSLIVISILCGVLAFAVFPIVNRKSTISRIKKMLTEGDNKAMLGHQAISLSPEGILGKNRSSESKINWSAIDKVVQNEKFFFLYISSVNAIVIPKSCFQSQKVQQEFLEYVNVHRG
ncbi:MAG TPA: hypothetical protein DCX53_04890 [Anaerolineae bacterium]|nr:hypothetical protein [Anaerolineae bacterium]